MLLFSDLDGTLIDEHQQLSDINRQKMYQLQDNGHQIVICTGRNILEMIPTIQMLDLPFDYLVLNNGAHILNQQLETLYEKVIDKNIGIDILNHTMTYQHMWSYFSDGHINLAYKDGITYDHAIIGQPPIDKDYKQAYQKVDHYQIICFNQDNHQIDEAQICYDYVMNHYSDYVEAYFNTYFVDVVPKGCSKGHGMKELLNIIDYHGDTYAIGDSYNDIPMLQQATYGYTFDKVNQDIQKHAYKIIHDFYKIIDDMLGGI
ncbi:MAG: HAD family hydrolase [Erysipelotrichaceae bacterium]|nr:HAD family hydrolase [Erysipelotrichaceae bacterium]